ncbi:hypothetical protein K457DRAFT_797947 [Linnemannia elongata AG-77]|uniref:Uncharacterized protein n=1 Tax=Linnemannia elongata AG-77 TaxID=1314771 RepID=A0A197JI33_9FUNG|nr:hypothetical protein K457DRAFT_797947 [Linnemannia elongata AG-77]
MPSTHLPSPLFLILQQLYTSPLPLLLFHQASMSHFIILNTCRELRIFEHLIESGLSIQLSTFLLFFLNLPVDFFFPGTGGLV